MRSLFGNGSGAQRAVLRVASRAVGLAILLAALATWGTGAWGAPGRTEPHLGYLWPAGARQGSVMRVWLGGQYLGGMNSIYVSGEGVRAKILFYAPPLNGQDFDELRRRQEERQRQGQGPAAAGMKSEPLSNNPLLDVLDALSPQDLRTVLSDFFNPDSKRQPNAQISETAFVEITIDPDAAPGAREVRIGTPAGLTNPMCFQVGTLPEVYEVQQFGVIKRPTPVLEPPVVVNGQITPGDTDRYRVHARQGQQFVFNAYARRLNPYLADAVPGWFQAVLTLYDPKGNRVAFGDDYGFDPDPILCYSVPEDGEYAVEIRDALFRGREDFVYRITVSEHPFITRIFPLGGQQGAETMVSIAGWNLPEKRLRLDTTPSGDPIRLAWLPPHGNRVRYAVDALPERIEQEPNNTGKGAQAVTLPVIVNGICDRPGDADVFSFEGRAGQEVVAEVVARRLGSPLDSLLRLIDTTGRVVAWNDDHADPGAGLLTHQADSHLAARLPKAGVYFVQLTDSQRHGDESFGYRLRIGPPRHDFALRVTPSSVNVPATGVATLTVYALRKDGFPGDIELALVDAPAGWKLGGAWVPHGRDSVRVTLAAPEGQLSQPVGLRMEGRARIGEATVTRPAVPAEEMMQAFAYWHYVPACEMLVDATRGRRGAAAEVVGAGPVRVPAGGSGRVHVKVPWRWAVATAQLELRDPPKGVSLQPAPPIQGDLSFLLKVDGTSAKPGYADNAIVEAFAKADNGGRYSLGLLPAIPFEVVRK